ncbi:unnamed protein product [Peniophora sp. CBMAI 1063]|nr:unnamed protein product [Peniophora sp. CBMAI 1063]
MFTTNARPQAHIPPPASKRHLSQTPQPTDKCPLQAATTRGKRLPEAPAAAAPRDPPVPTYPVFRHVHLSTRVFLLRHLGVDALNDSNTPDCECAPALPPPSAPRAQDEESA